MKRQIALVFALLVVSSFAFASEKPYDSVVTVAIMRANVQANGQLRSAAAEGNYAVASGALARLAQGSFTLLGYLPPKGGEDTWSRVHADLVAAALAGIVACSEQSKAGLDEAVAAIGALMREGHGAFR